MGIRGCLNLNAVGILKNIAQLGSRKATERHNDELILNEIMMEFACEERPTGNEPYGRALRRSVNHHLACLP